MRNSLSLIARTLRSPLFPRSVSYKLWSAAKKRSKGERFFYRTTLRGRSVEYGGVCGYSDDALFVDLNQYELDTIEVISKVLGSKPIIFDIGANNGAYLMILKSINPDAEIHCFEPFPQLASFLRELTRRNRFADVFLTESLVGAKNQDANLFFAEGATDTASVVSDFQAGFNCQLSAKQYSIDSYIRSKPRSIPTLIKIDVEGGELEVIEGALQTLADSRPDLILELLFTEKPIHLQRQVRVVELLQSLNYRFFQVQTGGQLSHQSSVNPDPHYAFLNYLVTVKDPALFA